MEASAHTSDVGPGLFAWLEHVASWEINRRQARQFLLRFPEEAMEASEASETLNALGEFAVTFRERGGRSELHDTCRRTSSCAATACCTDLPM